MAEANATHAESLRRSVGDDRHLTSSRSVRGTREPGADSASRTEAPSSAADHPGTLHEAAVRALDCVVALAGLVLTSPLLLVIAVAIKVESRGPVLYRQLRVGRDRRRQHGPEIVGDDGPNRRTGDLGGRPFCIYKFRTMHRNAEADTGPTWSGPGDDRTTRVGRFLRQHRLDELPQLWNVLKGDMAIVGPRPERPLIFQRLRDQIGGYTRRQDVRPGITGWAQINRASDQTVDDVEQKLRYDLEYLERRSLGFDAWVMLKTPLVMARPDLFLVGSSTDDARTQASGAGRSDGDAGRSDGAELTRLLPRPNGAGARSESHADVEAHV